MSNKLLADTAYLYSKLRFISPQQTSQQDQHTEDRERKCLFYPLTFSRSRRIQKVLANTLMKDRFNLVFLICLLSVSGRKY